MIRLSALVFIVAVALFPASANARPNDGEVTTRLLAALYGDSTAPEGVVADELRSLYASTGYQPIWRRDGVWTEQARDAMAVLGVSDRHGIDTARYGVDTLSELFNASAHALSADGATFGDLALSAAVLAYLSDQAAGRIDPTTTNWHSRTDSNSDAVGLLVQGLDAPDFATWLYGAAPVHGGYAALVREAQRLERLTGLSWVDINREGLIRPGKTDPRIPAIRDRLIVLGDYRVTRPVNPYDQTIDLNSDVFDDDLVAAVEQFQRRHGLQDDGVVGPETVAALNMSPADRIETITVNLERLRWQPDPAQLTGQHIIVNVAGYELNAYQDGQVALTMPVIVGMPNHKTPLLADQIVNVKFAPTWTVPDQIARLELLPKIQNDPSYLASNNFRVFADWAATVEVDPASVDWSSLSSSNMPYMLRQDSGRSNALGQIRFSLTNDLDIYLHDTGSRQLFAQAQRSLSHGCVRVGSPVQLADFLLDGLDKVWTEEEILVAMDSSGPHYQRLAQPVPVDLVYITAWVDAENNIQYRNDIYGYDTAVAEQLAVADSMAPATLTRLIDALQALDPKPANGNESPTVTAALIEISE